ncbi:C39 family peptidase [Corynebacterium mastitidis]|uniref:C39 family peptidase n=1 Tax=Corynebacterium mastitidis TaxID=161890 RepID=UPI002550863A|nr:C39 family peptidase [Corynebacterium mastitidis]MDK8450520.1 C39 family peptidase [Corynebacterium mastitidis]
MLLRFKRTLTAAALVASFSAAGAMGAVGTAAQAHTLGVRDVASWAASATTSVTSPRFHLVQQEQGQQYQSADCGPAAILMALLDNGGRLPKSYNRDSQAAAMTELRGEVPNPEKSKNHYLFVGDISTILREHGVQGTVYSKEKTVEIVDLIKQGRKAVVLIQSGQIPNAKGGPGGGHFVYVSGYDARTKIFAVNDPAKLDDEAYHASEKDLLRLITNPAPGNDQWAFVI